MEGIIRQIVGFLEQGIEAILTFLQLVWTWSFGEIIGVFRSDWQSLPVWKLVVLGIVVAGVVFFLYRAARHIWSAAVAVFRSFVELLSAFVTVMPYIVGAGALAFIGGYVIRTVNF